MSDLNLTAKTAATLDTNTFIGTVVTWDFGIGKNHDFVSVPRPEFVDLLNRCGYVPADVGLLPVDLEDALERARGVGWGAAFTLQKLQAEKGTPASYGVMKTDVSVEDAKGVVGARVRVVNGSVDVVAPVSGDLDVDCESVAHRVVKFVNELQETAVNRDLSVVLLNIVKKLGGVSMRHNSGGAYFLHNSDETQRFIALLEGIEQLTTGQPRDRQFYAHITVLRGDKRNVDTWHRNTTLAFDQELEALAAELTDMSTRDNVRDGTWDKKKVECTSLVLRANKFAGILQGELERIRKVCTELETKFGRAQDNARAAALGAKAAFAALDEVAAPEPPPPAPTAPAKPPVKAKPTLNPLKAFEGL